MTTNDRLRRHGRRGTGSVPGLVLALAAIATALAACGNDPEPEPRTDGLIVMSGPLGEAVLTIHDSADPGGREVPLPERVTTWVSAGRANVLMATLLDGRTFVSDPFEPGEDPEWRAVDAVGIDEEPLEGPVYFGAWDPPGGAYAVLATDFAAGAGLRVVVVDPALSGAAELDVPDVTAIAAPPAWVDEDRVAVVVAVDRGDPRAMIIDTTTGVTAAGPEPIALIATSADAAMAATWSGTGPVEVLPTEDWLGGESATIRIDPPDGARRPGVLALDAAGERLAILWLDGDGEPLPIAIHEADRNWRRSASIEVDGVAATAVAWLR